MHRATYCNVYISKPTRCTNSYNEAYTNYDTASKNVAPDDGFKSPKYVGHLMISKASL